MRPDILLVILDSVRARNLPFHGYARPTMPTLTDLARAGVVFTRAFSTSNWSLPTHASIFTGRRARAHGVSHAHHRLGVDLPTLPELLGGAGYRTAIFTANPYISDTFRMLRGFGHRFKAWQMLQTSTEVTHERMMEASPDRWPTGRTVLRVLLRERVVINLVNRLYGNYLKRRHASGGGRLVEAAGAWLRQERSEPALAVFNFMETHQPYRPPLRLARRFLPENARPDEISDYRGGRVALVNSGTWALAGRDREVLTALYDATLVVLDRLLQRLLDAIPRDRHTVAIIMADHGDLLGEGGFVAHEYSLADPLIHVPLVIWGPGIVPEGVARDGLVQIHDVYATILRLAGLTPPPETESLDLLADQAGRGFVFAEYDRPLIPLRYMQARVPDPPRLALLDRGLAAARTARHKLLVGTDGSEALYDLADDPAEARDLAGTPEEPPGVRDALRAVVRASSAQALAEPAEPEIDDETRRALERFGYLT